MHRHSFQEAVASPSRRFVDWEEQFISHDRGSRVVNYWLKDRNGASCLAVVGTERSLRHMVYVVTDEFLLLAGLDNCSTPAVKWRSRREVLDWLGTFICRPASMPCSSDRHANKSPKQENEAFSIGEDTDVLDGSSQDEGRFDIQSSAPFVLPSKDVVWVGACWTCRKRLNHYESFQRNGITISVNSFVYVMSEGDEHHIAYIEDMYEDKKCRKKVRVRWFHKTDELVGPVPLPAPQARELFMTPFPQVLSVECVDGGAVVLTPEHYEKCLSTRPDYATQVHVCFRQFDNEGVKPFDISGVKGYWNQKFLTLVLSAFTRDSLHNEDLSDSTELCDEETDIGTVIKRGPRAARSSRKRTGKLDRSRALTYLHDAVEGRTGNHVNTKERSRKSFNPGDKVERLCEDSGIRGCWYRCTIVAESSGQMKVRYEDLESEDGCGLLEEWVPFAKVANPGKLGIRASERLILRPSQTEALPAHRCEVGVAVDAWWNDGWWEGVIANKEIDGKIQVYFPDENDMHLFNLCELRLSKEWVHGQWVDVKQTINVGPIVGKVSALQSSRDLSSNLSETSSGEDKSPATFRNLAVECSNALQLATVPAEVRKFDSGNKVEENLDNNGCTGMGFQVSGEGSVVPVYDQSVYTEIKKPEVDSDKGESSVPDLPQKFSRKRSREPNTLGAKTSGSAFSSKLPPLSTPGMHRLQGRGTRELLLASKNLKESNKNRENKVTEDLPKAKRSQSGQENAKPMHGTSVAGSLFNAVPLASLVLSR